MLMQEHGGELEEGELVKEGAQEEAELGYGRGFEVWLSFAINDAI